jgi:hypothetical protein
VDDEQVVIRIGDEYGGGHGVTGGRWWHGSYLRAVGWVLWLTTGGRAMAA